MIFSTIHTPEAADVISRILSVFPSEEQKEAKLILSSVLKVVVAQRLIPKKDGSGFLPTCEILINNPRVQQEIENNGSADKIRTIMKESKSHWGMQTFDQHLISMVKEGFISERDATKYSSSPEKIKLAIKGISYENNYHSMPSNQNVPPNRNLKSPNHRTNKISDKSLSLKKTVA